jgi:hypothetical protein
METLRICRVQKCELKGVSEHSDSRLRVVSYLVDCFSIISLTVSFA